MRTGAKKKIAMLEAVREGGVGRQQGRTEGRRGASARKEERGAGKGGKKGYGGNSQTAYFMPWEGRAVKVKRGGGGSRRKEERAHRHPKADVGLDLKAREVEGPENKESKKGERGGNPQSRGREPLTLGDQRGKRKILLIIRGYTGE